jgi:hypothetical protein
VRSGLGSLSLAEDSQGLLDALLNSNDPDVQRLREEAGLRLIDEMSFSSFGDCNHSRTQSTVAQRSSAAS